MSKAIKGEILISVFEEILKGIEEKSLMDKVIRKLVNDAYSDFKNRLIEGNFYSPFLSYGRVYHEYQEEYSNHASYYNEHSKKIDTERKQAFLEFYKMLMRISIEITKLINSSKESEYPIVYKGIIVFPFDEYN